MLASPGNRQVNRDRAFASPAFDAANNDNHLILISINILIVYHNLIFLILTSEFTVEQPDRATDRLDLPVPDVFSAHNDGCWRRRIVDRGVYQLDPYVCQFDRRNYQHPQADRQSLDPEMVCQIKGVEMQVLTCLLGEYVQCQIN